VRSTERPFAEEEDMSTSKTRRWRRVPIQVGVVAAVATGAAGAIAGAAIANDDDDPASEVLAADAAVDADGTEAVPVWIMVREQQRLRQITDRMPSGWPATDVMSRAAEQPLGDAVARARWSRDAERMPAGWPATEVMRRAAANDEG
jgi:ribosomal protein L39E